MGIHEWYNETIGKNVVEALKKNGFDAVYFDNSREAAEYVLSFISSGNTVGIGGSMTVKEMNIPDMAREKGAEVLDHNIPGLSPDENIEIRRKQLTCDVFLCSSNAITMDGYIVNVDGVGNRVNAMTFGPRKVVIVAGINKICKDVDAAFERIGSVASPKNNKRLNFNNPCLYKGCCQDCQGNTRSCRVYSIIKKKPMLSNITVVIVGENLGF